MAIFRDGTDDYQRLDYALLRNGANTLYYRPEVLAKDLAQLKEYDYEIVEFNCTEWAGEGVMHNDFAQKLDFPGYYGKNPDALNDCLCDLEIKDESGLALVFNRFDYFAAANSRVAWDVLDIIEHNSRTYLLYGKRLLALAQSNDPTISFNGLGSSGANWNHQEWLNSARGL